jgi:hypothetical protein
MNVKRRQYQDEELSSSKKKVTKRHYFAEKKKTAFEQIGAVTDIYGNLLKVGSIVEFSSLTETLEGEIVKIHSNNVLTVLYDDVETNKITTHDVHSSDVRLILF